MTFRLKIKTCKNQIKVKKLWCLALVNKCIPQINFLFDFLSGLIFVITFQDDAVSCNTTTTWICTRQHASIGCQYDRNTKRLLNWWVLQSHVAANTQVCLDLTWKVKFVWSEFTWVCSQYIYKKETHIWPKTAHYICKYSHAFLCTCIENSISYYKFSCSQVWILWRKWKKSRHINLLNAHWK